MWIPANNKYAVAVHNWHTEIRYGLALDVGDLVEILEECGPWYRGKCLRKPTGVGIFPKSYVCAKDMSKIDPVVAECTEVLREWSEMWKKLFVDREDYKFSTLTKVMNNLLEGRKELLSATLTQDQTLELQMQVVDKIDWGNRKLGLDMVPRNGPLAVDPHEIGIVKLYEVHVASDNAKTTSQRGTLRAPVRKHLKKPPHHLYMCMRDFGHRIGDEAEIYFSLFHANSNRMRHLSERFVVKISKEGFSNYAEKLNNNCTVFRDLGAADLGEDLYLVAVVVRVGKIIHSESIKKIDKISSTAAFRRPYGIGVLNLNEVCQIESTMESEEKEFSFKIYQTEEKDFYQLHELIIKKISGKFSPLNTGTANTSGITVSLKLLHGALTQARQEQPLLFQDTPITQKLGFPDIIMPGDVRNDMFITLDRAEFERGGKTTAKNIEITLSVLDVHGNIIQGSLWGAAGMNVQENYKSMILYHQNQPCWNETIRLSVPIEKFSNAHIRFEFKHVSTRDKSEPKLYGFSFANLMEPSGATLSDGSHDLCVYKCEDINKLIPENYLKLPSKSTDTKQSFESNALFNRSSKEFFAIKSLLCSTKLTQNSDLLSLLQCDRRSHPEKIQESLTGVLRLRDEELVKFLQDVLDVLFAMFSNEEGNSTEHSGLVFHVLVSIFNILQSNKFQHFKPVMNAYIDDHFSAALVYKGLITSVEHLAHFMTKAEHHEPFQKCFSSLEYIFKLIIQSRKLFARATGGQYEDTFKRDLYSLFHSLNDMLRVPSTDVVAPTQIALLHSTGVVLEQLKDTLPASELGFLAKNMLSSVPLDSPQKLIQAKLQAVLDLVSGKLFLDDASRSDILAVACEHLKIHLEKLDELQICSKILAQILSHLHQVQGLQKDKMTNTLHHDLDLLCQNLLNILMHAVFEFVGGNNTVLPSLVSNLLGLLQLLEEAHFKHFWDKLTMNGSTLNLKDFIRSGLYVFQEILTPKYDIFQEDWFVIKLAANDVIRKSLEEFAKPLVFTFLDANSFDSQLWWGYFSLAVIFLTQSLLQLEQYNELKRRKILHSYGDMRVLMGFQILSMWSHLDEHKLHFIPSMVGPFLEVTLVPEQSLRKATLTVFYDMMEYDQAARGSFRLVESELIDKLDQLIGENKGDDDYKELFSKILLDKVYCENPSWKEAGVAFISSVSRLLERLLDYRNVMQGDENRDKRMFCTVNLLKFYKNEINRKEMYVRYIYKLHDLHFQAENYTEAGFTLKLYADMLSWNKEELIFAPNEKNARPEWKVKEILYYQILRYFDKGKCWEKGIPLCKELASLYESVRFDYIKLNEILTMQAKFFLNIINQLRPEPEYFRVGFYGMNFPLFLRNKQFVYRGLEYERIGAFTQRIQIEFPQSQVLTKNSTPDKSIMLSNNQYIQISNVRPVRDGQLFRNAMVPVPEKIAKFYQVNDITKFIHDRPIYKGIVDKENEFKSLWIERTTMEIEYPLPGILRCYEVVTKSMQELTPIEFACETMDNVKKELYDLIVQYRNDPKRNINPFSMRLQGIIDANVMGGVSKYQEAFFSEEFLSSCGQSQLQHVHKLKSSILEQIQDLETALELHGELAPTGVQPLHSRLLERFSQLKQSLSGLGKPKRQNSESIINTPLPPLPTEKLKAAFNNYGIYESDEIYTRPGEFQKYEDKCLQENSSRKKYSDSVNNIGQGPPPIPVRPKSAGYIPFENSQNNNSSSIQSAPPLPPRGITPDKRSSNPYIFGETINDLQENNSIKVSHKYSVVNISLEGPECDAALSSCAEFKTKLFQRDRDSSISSSLNEVNDLNDSNKFDSTNHQTPSSQNDEQLNIQPNLCNNQIKNAPPIPPKSLNISVCDISVSCATQDSGDSGYSFPNVHQNSDAK
ncbi:dedicator of cytokinesis protein 3 [Condylostylus longicornis]|uniref:dedicator of cytokinesis protein 3 n=1 Tax=Condylostylus longicornis TaxID=2530218 RepID=UPI00244E1159|nr:dedicator of cytokinesis protein 3 [Condylostylus longicornis]